MADINRRYGYEVIRPLLQPGQSVEDVAVKRWSTGLPDLDYAVGGGMPCGRIIEMYGQESAGKTSLAYHLLARHPYALWVDFERTFDVGFAMGFGVLPDRVFLQRPFWAEEGLESVLKFAREGCPFIVVDSVGAMKTKNEMEEDNLLKGMMGTELARLLDRFMPQLVNACEDHGTTVLFINQVREKVGAMLFQDPYTTKGGRQLRHLASLRMKVARKEWIETEVQKKKERIGQVVRIQVTKSKVCPPFREAELLMAFDRGFVVGEDVRFIVEQWRQKNLGRPAARNADRDHAVDGSRNPEHSGSSG